VLDLQQDQEVMLAEMRAKTRHNIRHSQRSGVTVREGTAAELHDYYHLVAATSQRKNFSVFPEEYFSAMWRSLRPHGYIKLFLAEFKGEIVSAQIAIPFGDTVINKLSVWSGQHASQHPNEALMWGAIAWAKAHGYRYYDFEGIDPTVARLILQQQDLPDSLKHTVTTFKLGFGGEVKFFPGVYGYIPNAFLRGIYTTIFAKLPNSPMVYAALHNLRTL
jgi:lipid II:glycine glycyltransferase (peptidoglycan interpeptide bridge formation enzyme)